MNEQQAVAQSMQTAAAMAQKYGVELGAELSAELQSPTQYDQPQDDPGYIPNFYENDTWASIQPREQAKPVDTRAQEEIAYEQYLIQKQKAEQPQEQAEQVQGANARLVATSLEYGWETPSFQAYLDSDDDAYMSMRLSPQQLQLANEVWGLDEDTAKAYVYHHKLTPDDLRLIEMSFTGQASTPAAMPSAPSQKQIPNTDDDDVDADSLSLAPNPNADSSDDSAGDYDYVAALGDVNHMRRTYFSQASDTEWSSILNDVIDEFESLSPLEREPYDNPAGLWALYQRVSYRRQQQQAQARKQAQQRQQPSRLTNDNPRGSSKRNTQGFSNSALTPRGFLRQSWIDKLSPDDYAKNADRITAWYTAKKVDRNA
ncbi:MAG: hypothetical protein CLLPBCKN_004892 [Chroococcidiopsis cubana SAG 39.79]|uniref:Uncharacterized protein n=1 Tax=Chroococcidiopsis cubana SAG 39.79 TaxID=388085 RepID=A0AB37UJQ6_9CYAN|nr:hypothetical protein [Chroococcidiopsis cubana]MDZ4875496.1 hypothetical protein [Chroococcidiopsis cubana SAG 39.79]PSB64149.1 hypothetical protein C7B79_10945 [Chroococcidiopsis cubana CCALA 043]RUT11584.1 hypothetical protein DSM107010_30710 [Chroococcidiopsis cubana SAG 39.79]